MKFNTPIPLSLYIHIPWCIRKCPYCDFNSHRAPQSLPEDEYIDALIQDLELELPQIWGRRLVSIFIGGGTPSLFSAKHIEKLIQAIYARIGFAHPDIEITMEANPGTFEQEKFKDFRLAGVNRLSIGIQSFQSEKLKSLGRVHNDNESKKAVEIAHAAGFENFNLDLMHGLPNQSIDDALYDLQTAIDFDPPHLSWYQLTLEPNTVFAKHPPKLPVDERLWDIQQAGDELLTKHHFNHYEISAYAKKDFQCLHNLNYWQFGDYLGIGAGAHSKITDLATQTVKRFAKAKNPKRYMQECHQGTFEERLLTEKDMPIEFMMNALRLIDGVDINLFSERTGLSLMFIQTEILKAQAKGLLEKNVCRLKTTKLGARFLNECLSLFM